MIWALLKLAHWIWRRRFLNFVNVFSLFCYYLPFNWKRMEPFIWTNLNCLYPKNAVCKVWLKMALWFWRIRILNFVNVHVFLLFYYHLTLGNGGTLHLNKLGFLSPKDALLQVWLKLAHCFWRRRFLNVFSLFCYYLPLDKGVFLQLNMLEFPSPKNTLRHVLLKYAQWFWRRRRTCAKFTTTTTTTTMTDNGKFW